MNTEIFLIGGSAGSLKVLLQLLPDLKIPQFPILIVLHRSPAGHSIINSLLGNYTNIPIVDIEDKTALEAGRIYIAPADYHVLIEKDKTVTLDYSEKFNYSRPSIDVTFMSAARIYKERTFALLLSGANDDGSEGLRYIKSLRGSAIVQDPKTCEVSYMPTQALNKGGIDLVIRPEEIAAFINKLNIT